MASIGHLAIGLSAGRLYARGERVRVVAAMVAFAAASLLPDADVILHRFGVHYDDPLGHRGATHSLVFAVAAGVMAAIAGKLARLSFARTLVFTIVVIF